MIGTSELDGDGPFLLCEWNFVKLFVKMGKDAKGGYKPGLVTVLSSKRVGWSRCLT